MNSALDLASKGGYESITAARDPFYLVKEDVQGLVDNVQNNFRKWQQSISGSIEGSQLGQEIAVDCATIDWQVEELDKAIAVAERDPARYGLNSTEVAQRKKWTNLTRNQVTAIKKSVQEAQSNGSAIRVEMHRMPLNALKQKTAMDASMHDEDFYMSESDKQALLMKEQDQDLDDLSVTVERLGDVGLTIHDELVSQERIIDDLGQEMENTANRLDFVQKKVAVIMKKAGAKGQILLIIFLVVLLLVLILLVFS